MEFSLSASLHPVPVFHNRDAFNGKQAMMLQVRRTPLLAGFSKCKTAGANRDPVRYSVSRKLANVRLSLYNQNPTMIRSVGFQPRRAGKRQRRTDHLEVKENKMERKYSKPSRVPLLSDFAPPSLAIIEPYSFSLLSATRLRVRNITPPTIAESLTRHRGLSSTVSTHGAWTSRSPP
jgi:hypothetical protein